MLNSDRPAIAPIVAGPGSNAKAVPPASAIGSAIAAEAPTMPAAATGTGSAVSRRP